MREQPARSDGRRARRLRGTRPRGRARREDPFSTVANLWLTDQGLARSSSPKPGAEPTCAGTSPPKVAERDALAMSRVRLQLHAVRDELLDAAAQWAATWDLI